MSLKKNSKLYVYDEKSGVSSTLNEMFVAETELIKYLRRGSCCWIVSNNG